MVIVSVVVFGLGNGGTAGLIYMYIVVVVFFVGFASRQSSLDER
jgi:hypothetical protein